MITRKTLLSICLTLGTLAFAENTSLLTEQLVQIEKEFTSFDENKMVADDSLDKALTTPMQEELAVAEEAATAEKRFLQVDLKQAFFGSPIIYSILAVMSTLSFAIWSYSMLRIKREIKSPINLLNEVRHKLLVNQYDEASKLLANSPHIICKMVLSLIEMRRFGLPAMMESMNAEGKQATVSFWQKLGLLSDIAVIAPMLGLLGTVLGMFYAFYDLNRSIESISTLFDGLGVSVGTTVAGLIVALFAMMFHSLAKYRLVQQLATVENEAQRFVPLIHNQPRSS